MASLTDAQKEGLIEKYRERLARNLGVSHEAIKAAIPKPDEDSSRYSSNYIQFKKENLPRHLTFYEEFCRFCGRFLQVNPGKKRSEELKKLIQLSHIDATPSSTVSAALFGFLAVMLAGVLVWLLSGSLLVIGYSFMMAAIVLVAMLKLPDFFANNWRLQASNQMVQCIFYIATYMRHTSNLELAVRFAADRLSPPLSLDLKKVLWDVETNRYDTIRESIDNYLETWREWNLEFIESFHLLEGSLYEPSEDRRAGMIDKALNVMLEETYDRMMRYARELKSPVTMLYMLGLVLPILGLVILPMVASFMTSDVPPLKMAVYIAVLYNLTLPLLIWYLTKTTLSKRPTGYGEADISEEVPALKKYRNIVFSMFGREFVLSPLIVSVVIGAILLFLGLLPWLAGFAFSEDALLNERAFEPSLGFKFLEYKIGSGGKLIGPYGIGAAVFSLFVPLAFGLGFGLYSRLRSRNVFEIREKAKKLEEEFASALFQLGNRLGDGVPVERAIGRVAEMMKGTASGEFFSVVEVNMTSMGMSVEKAIFNPKTGAINYFPSPIIESAMKVLIETSRKGPQASSIALINVSEYIKDIHRVNERLKDLMADVISDMKQQVSILAPAIAGIVVGITSMIIGILGRLTEQISGISSISASDVSVPSGILTLFGDGVPTYYFQIIIGLYIVELIYIMSVLINGIESGSDKLSERYLVGSSLIKSIIVYAFIALAVMVIFNTIAGSIVGSLATASMA